jgi:hypothetical protein
LFVTRAAVICDAPTLTPTTRFALCPRPRFGFGAVLLCSAGV